jgi:hypothetical protein
MLTVFSGAFFKMPLVGFSAIFLILYNSSRGAIVGVVVSLLLVFIFRQFRNGEKGIVALLASAVLGVVVLVGVGLDPETVGDLVFSAKKVLTLDSSGEVLGSNQVRAAVLVYSMKEFIDSWLLGIGAGNSILMLQSGKYPFIDVVKSIHNMPMQLLLELGAVFFVAIFLMLKKVSPLKWPEFLVVVCSYLVVSITQSGGFIVNYFAFMCFLCSVLSKKFQEGINVKSH